VKLLELFAGSRSVGVVAEAMGFEVFSTDIRPFDRCYAKDILAITQEDIPFIPDIIWASPDCTTFSIAAISTHRNGTEPKSDKARHGDAMLAKTLEIISWFPQAKFFIENPMGMMRKMPMLRGVHRAEVTYCSYGDRRMKPTDIFTNHHSSIFNPSGWMPRDKCFNGNGNCHHEAAPRGSKTGTQGLKGSYERSRIPYELVREILESCQPQPATISLMTATQDAYEVNELT
jgi:hypothetical protein